MYDAHCRSVAARNQQANWQSGNTAANHLSRALFRDSLSHNGRDFVPVVKVERCVERKERARREGVQSKREREGPQVHVKRKLVQRDKPAPVEEGCCGACAVIFFFFIFFYFFFGESLLERRECKYRVCVYVCACVDKNKASK